MWGKRAPTESERSRETPNLALKKLVVEAREIGEREKNGSWGTQKATRGQEVGLYRDGPGTFKGGGQMPNLKGRGNHR